MIAAISRAAIAAAILAMLGAAALIQAVSRHPDLTLDMDRDLPRSMVAGLYPVERNGDETFAWTMRRVDVRLTGANRINPWMCIVRFRGGRADPATQPTLDGAVDGIAVASLRASNDFQDLEIPIPARPAKSGLTFSITSSDVIVPGPSDRRELGVQVDRLSCRPTQMGIAFPPARVLGHAAASAALFGAAFVFVGLTLGIATIAGAGIALGQSILLSSGAAPYTGFSETLLWFALWSAGLMVASVHLIERVRRQPLEMTARAAVIFSTAAFYLKVLGLLHPSKLPIDVVFHAHRFEAVLSGHFYFTQGMPSGVSFPYAIGLYLFAAPWSGLTADHAALLRVVVCALEVIAGALLYPMIVRRWGDRVVAALAVVLFNSVPLPYGLVGNANLTNAFGQSAALIAIGAAVTWPFRPPARALQVAGLFALCALAFLSHVSTFAILVVTLGSAAALGWWFGSSDDRANARLLLVVSVLAALFAIVTYWGHFTDVYLTALRARQGAATAPAATLSDNRGSAAPSAPRPTASPAIRMANAIRLTADAIGWPLLALAAFGCWHLRARGPRDRLVVMLAAWGVAYAVFVTVSLMRVDAPLERYAAEFVGRVVFATYPAVVILAALGAAWSWRAGVFGRLGGGLLVAVALVNAEKLWVGWFR